MSAALRATLILTLFISLILITSALADTPQLLNYQGRLTDDAGIPLSGAYDLNFSLYNVGSGGSPQWTETHTSVSVAEGQFSVLLGSVNPFPEDLFEQAALYLGIAVDSDPEMIPRQRVTSVPYAQRVGSIDGASSGMISGALTIEADSAEFYKLRISRGIGADLVVDTEGHMGVGSFRSLTDLHVTGDAGSIVLDASDLSDEDVIVEGRDAVLGIYSDRFGTFGSGITLGEVNSGQFEDKWTIWRERSDAGKALRFTYGSGVDPFFNNTRVKFESNGDVGIGEENPQAKLHLDDFGIGVTGSALQEDDIIVEDDDAVLGLYSDDGGSAGSALALGEVIGGNLNNKWTIIRETANAGLRFTFGTASNPYNNPTRFFIESTGEVGIGTRNPNYDLDVRGTIGNNTTLYHSDERWKKNVATIENALDQVTELRGVTFEWRRDEFGQMNFPASRKIGLIAQEVEQVIPEVVNTNKNGFKSVEYANLVAVLVEAVKELRDENRAQDEQINILLDKIEQMQANY